MYLKEVIIQANYINASKYISEKMLEVRFDCQSHNIGHSKFKAKAIIDIWIKMQRTRIKKLKLNP